MRRSFSILGVLLLAALLNGCILAKSPSADNVVMATGTQATFSVTVFPGNATYAWTLDGAPLATTANAHAYTALYGRHTLSVRATHFMGTDTQAWIIYGIHPPVAAAAGPKLALARTTVTLDGTGSSDPSGDALAYHWRQTAGPAVTLSDADRPQARFTAPVAPGKQLVFELTVTDVFGLAATATCTIIAVDANIDVDDQNLVIRTDGSLWVWGMNASGQLGDGTTGNKLVPTRIGAAADWVAVSAGYGHSVALKADGSLWAWGSNGYGQLGDGTTVNQTVPTRIGSDTDWIALSAGVHTLAIKADGSLWAWGLNASGQLGDGTTVNKLVPTRIGSDTDWIVVFAGKYHSLALKADGSLWAWGQNDACQLGDGTTRNKLVPTRIGAAIDWVAVGAGVSHNLALKADGALWAWGMNATGQLGDGTTGFRLVPTRIGDAADWVAVSAGGGHSLALKADGSLWAWGWNRWYGQLGDGTMVDRLVPMRIGAAADWVAVSAGRIHSLAVKADGSFWTWGANDSGQLGDGTTSNKNVPTPIGAPADW